MKLYKFKYRQLHTRYPNHEEEFEADTVTEARAKADQLLNETPGSVEIGLYLIGERI